MTFHSVQRALNLCALCALAALPAVAVGQELDPRAYSATPIGTNFALVGLGNTNGDVVFDSNSAITDVHANVDMASFGAGRVFPVAGLQSSVALGLPYAWGDVSGNVGEDARSVSRSGLADPRVRFGLMLFGGPALDRRTFASTPRRPILGTSLTVMVPVGQYDPAKLINIGTNRWAFKPELGFSYPLGRWQLDAYVGAWLFADNSNYYGGKRREQDPIWSQQIHASYTLRPGFWVAADATYYSGGTSTVNGVRNADRQSNTRIGLTLSVPLSQGWSVKVAASDGAVTRIGGDFRSINIALQYAWFD